MSDGGVEGDVEREATEVESDLGQRVNRLRRFAESVAERVGGHPGVVRLQAIMDTYDRGGGGLVAGGLAYTSLLAVLPGFLLALSVIGLIVRDEETQRQIVAVIAQALPPFEDIARTAFTQVAQGAVPSGILAIVALFWGSSRFYANLDTAFSRIFSSAPRRNPVLQTVRGILLTVILVLLPVALVVLGSLVSWLTSFTPGGIDAGAVLTVALGVGTPIGSVVAFGVAVALCYRFVPSEHVPWRALLLPAGAIGLVLAVFTQLYVIIFPRLVGLAAVYGTALAIFALLAWLSIAFNVLLVGAAWTQVRARLGPFLEVRRPERAVEADDMTKRDAEAMTARQGRD